MAVETHKVEVVPIILETHPYADKLSIVHIYNWQVVVNTEFWKDKTMAAYIQPDSIVDVTRPEFSWLKRTPDDTKPHRVKVIRLRKVLSQGLLTPAPEGSQIGDDVTELLGVTHYDPPTQDELEDRGSVSAEEFTVPNVWVPKYDVESMYRYASAFVVGETVYVTEKLDGQNSKFLWDPGQKRMWAGTRKEWKKEGMGAPWDIVQNYPWITDFCREYPLRILFGEIFGWIATLRYGVQPGEYMFRAFDVLDGLNFWDAQHLFSTLSTDRLVPLLGVHSFDFEKLKELAEGETLIPCDRNTNQPDKTGKKPLPNMREGIVVRPGIERQDYKAGRVHLKLVSNNYLELVKDDRD